MKDRITIEGNDGSFNAYIARPKTLPAPAVVVLQEVFGVNADIRRHCDKLAEQDFLAVAPDLFWRQEPGVDLSVSSDADWAHGLRLYAAYDRDAGATDVKDTVNAVRNLTECNGKVALLGYCFGALTVFIAAVRHQGVDAAAAYHGGDTEKYLGEADGLSAPLLMHLAEEDEFISSAAQAEIKASLAKKPKTTVYSYPGQNHAFSRHNGPTTMLLRPHSPTGGPVNFYIDNCGDLQRRTSFRVAGRNKLTRICRNRPEVIPETANQGGALESLEIAWLSFRRPNLRLWASSRRSE